MNWARALSGTYVQRSYDTGAPCGPEYDGLQLLMAAMAEQDTQAAIKREQDAEAARRAERVAHYEQKADRDLGREPGPLKRRRGAPAPVVCLTFIDPSTGELKTFANVSRAGEWVGQKADNVCQAIKRGGTCGRQRFAYVGDLTANQLTAHHRAAVQTPRTVRARGLERRAVRIRRPGTKGRTGGLVLLAPGDWRA